MNARQRALAAFAVIDAHHEGAQSAACPMFAYTELAAAMNQIYGALPDERLVAVLAQIEREEE